MKVRQEIFEGVGGLKLEEVRTMEKLKASLKYDGSQYHMHIKDNEIYALTSKRESKKTGLLSERLDNMPELRDEKFSFSGETIIVCEISAECMYEQFIKGKLIKPNGESYTWNRRSNFVASIMNANPETIVERYPKGNPLRLIGFSVIWYNGRDVRNWNYADRRKVLLDHFPSAGVSGKNATRKNLVYAITDFPARRILKVDKNAFDEGVIREKFLYEGFVVNEQLTMRAFKIKKIKEADCIVIGFDWESTGKYKENGWIKSIIVGCFVKRHISTYNKNYLLKREIDDLVEGGELIEVGKISGFNEDLREEISSNPTKYLGQPVECEFHNWTGSKMRHPRISDKGFRTDKLINRCVIDQME